MIRVFRIWVSNPGRVGGEPEPLNCEEKKVKLKTNWVKYNNYVVDKPISNYSVKIYSLLIPNTKNTTGKRAGYRSTKRFGNSTRDKK